MIFTTESGNVCAIETKFVLSDMEKGRLVIFFDCSLKNKVSLSKQSYKFVYKKGNFNRISEFILNIDWVSLYENKQVQEIYDDLIFYTSEASNLFIPIVVVSVIKIRQHHG